MHWDRSNLFERDDVYCAPVHTETTCFLHGGSERLAWFEPTEAAKFLKKLEVHSVLNGHRKCVFEREFLCLERFHGRFLHFDNGVKEKPQNVHLKVIFCHVLSWFNLRERIQDPVSVIRELLFWINFMGFWIKVFKKLSYLSVIAHS